MGKRIAVKRHWRPRAAQPTLCTRSPAARSLATPARAAPPGRGRTGTPVRRLDQNAYASPRSDSLGGSATSCCWQAHARRPSSR